MAKATIHRLQEKRDNKGRFWNCSLCGKESGASNRGQADYFMGTCITPYVENPAGLEIGYQAAREAREENASAFYASPIAQSDSNGCSCSPNKGRACRNCF